MKRLMQIIIYTLLIWEFMKMIKWTFLLCIWMICAGAYAQNEQGAKEKSFVIKKEVSEAVMKSANTVTQKDYQFILDFIERLCNAYYTKDIQFLEMVFGDCELVVTKDEIKSSGESSHSMSSSKQYCNTLKKMFERKNNIEVLLDAVKILKHPAQQGVYAVTFRHGWTSERYSDTGVLTMLWNLSKLKAPKLCSRIWQPDAFPGMPLMVDSLAVFELLK